MVIKNDQAAMNGRSGGYTALASFLSSDTDSETLIFRKFDNLSALNLLYMQSELLELEAEINNAHLSTIDSPDLKLRSTARRWETLVEQCKAKDCPPEIQRRMDVVRELRDKMAAYQDALLRQKSIAAIRSPESRVLETVKDFFHKKPSAILGGKAATKIFDEESLGDLVSLRAPAETDMLSRFLRRIWPGIDESDSNNNDYVRFSETSIIATVNIITTLTAAAFLIGTITSFYFVRSPALKLGLIALFTVAFAVSVGVLTNARRVEIVAATAAYAAVLVVFVSNSDLSSAGASSS